MYTYIHNIYVCTLHFMVQLKTKVNILIKLRDTHQIHGDTMIFHIFKLFCWGPNMSKYVWPPFLARFLEGMLKHPSSKDALFWEGLKKRFHIVWSSQTWTERSKIIRLFIPLRSGYSWPAGCLDFWAYIFTNRFQKPFFGARAARSNILVLLAQNPRI